MFAPLTTDQLTALQDYASKHGRTWKASLREDWYHARLMGPVHALRNSHGPTWLAGFKLPPAMPVKSTDNGNHYGLPALPVKDDGSPGFIHTKVEADRKSPAVKWSNKNPVPPAVGDTVTVTMNGIGKGKVLGYFIEHGWLGLHVWPSKPPDWFRKQNKGVKFYPGQALVFGAEVSY